MTFKRPEVLEGYTQKLETPCGDLYLTLNEHEGKLCEVRVTMGKSGTCINIMQQTIALLLSVMFQSGVSKEKVYKALLNQYEGNCGNGTFYKGDYYHSCIDFIIKRILEDLASREEIKIEKEEI